MVLRDGAREFGPGQADRRTQATATMANDAARSQNAELGDSTAVTTAVSVGDNHLLTGKKLAIAFAAMLLALLRACLQGRDSSI